MNRGTVTNINKAHNRRNIRVSPVASIYYPQKGGDKMKLKSLITKVMIRVFLGIFASNAYA